MSNENNPSFTKIIDAMLDDTQKVFRRDESAANTTLDVGLAVHRLARAVERLAPPALTETPLTAEQRETLRREPGPIGVATVVGRDDVEAQLSAVWAVLSRNLSPTSAPRRGHPLWTTALEEAAMLVSRLDEVLKHRDLSEARVVRLGREVAVLNELKSFCQGKHTPAELEKFVDVKVMGRMPIV